MRHNHFLYPFVTLLMLLIIGNSTGLAYAAKEGKRTSAGREAAEVHMQLGQRYMQKGDLERALQNLQKALKDDPSFPDAHTVIAVLYDRINDLKNAEQHYKRAVELLPKNGAANNNYGTYLCKQGKYDLAQKYFEQAVADPFYQTPAVAYANAGSCQVAAGNIEKAETSFRKTLELAPNDSHALIELTSILVKKQDYFRARAFMQRYESLNSPSAATLALGREIESKLGNAVAADHYAAQLLDLFPDSEQARALAPSS